MASLHHKTWRYGGCCWLIPCFIWGHETGWWRLHKSLGPMEPLILTNLQWWRRGFSISECACECMWSWHLLSPWTYGGCCWLIPCFIWGHETGWWRLHKSLGPMEPLILTNLQWWRRGFYISELLCMWWHGITSMAWRLLLTYSMLHLGSWDRLMKTSQVSRANGTTHTHQSSVMKEGLFLLWQLSSVWWYGITSMVMEVVADLFHASFGVMRQVDEDFTSL